MYATNAMSKYQAFVDDVKDGLQRVESTESTILLGDFNAHIGTDDATWKGMIDRHFNKNDWYSLQIYCSNKLCIMNTFF